jgi:hypothetical protein
VEAPGRCCLARRCVETAAIEVKQTELDARPGFVERRPAARGVHGLAPEVLGVREVASQEGEVGKAAERAGAGFEAQRFLVRDGGLVVSAKADEGVAQEGVTGPVAGPRGDRAIGEVEPACEVMDGDSNRRGRDERGLVGGENVDGAIRGRYGAAVVRGIAGLASAGEVLENEHVESRDVERVGLKPSLEEADTVVPRRHLGSGIRRRNAGCRAGSEDGE